MYKASLMDTTRLEEPDSRRQDLSGVSTKKLYAAWTVGRLTSYLALCLLFLFTLFSFFYLAFLLFSPLAPPAPPLHWRKGAANIFR
mmetsp:Transcript_14063/g.48464  ORF Transcript_14063/g.48464 Transcript_14063/m.48464 type:complete len:86 (+) Transcript_14063:1926-2183(+)